MAISEKDIFESLMKDPNHAYNPIEKVWAEAQQRARQFRNNEKALALAFDEPSALSKLVNFLTKADGNVEPEDLPRGFDMTGFFNDYQKFGRDGGLTWDAFKERYKNFIPYIHRAFDLDLEDDEPDIEELFDDAELMGIVDKIEAGESIPDFAPERVGAAPVEEPAADPDPEPEAELPELGDGLIDTTAEEEPPAEEAVEEPEEEVPEEGAEEPAEEAEAPQRPNFSDKDDPKAEGYSHIREASEALPSNQQPFEDSQGFTWSSLPAMHDFLFNVETGLFSQKNIDAKHDIYSDADVSEAVKLGDESFGENNWPIADFRGVIPTMKGGGRSNKVGNIKDRLRATYLRYFNDNKAAFAEENYSGLIEKMQYHMGQLWLNALNRKAGSKNLSESDKEKIDAVIQNTPEDPLASREEMKEFGDAVKTQATPRSPQAEKTAEQINDMRTSLAGSSGILDAIDAHLIEEEDRGPRYTLPRGADIPQVPIWGRLSEDEFQALKDFIPPNARVHIENTASLRDAVRDYQRLLHLRSTILRINLGGRGVLDEDIERAYTTSTGNMFKRTEDKTPVLSDDIQKVISAATIQLTAMRLTKEKFDKDSGEISEPDYTKRLSMIKGQVPFMPRTKASNEQDAAFNKRLKEAYDNQNRITLNYNQMIKPVEPEAPREPRAGRGRGSAVGVEQIPADQDEEDAEKSLRDKANELATRDIIGFEGSDEDRDVERQTLYNQHLNALREEAANANRGEQTLITSGGEEIPISGGSGAAPTGGEANEWVQKLLNEYGENTSLSLDQVTALLSGSLTDKPNGEAFILVKKTLDDGEINPNWKGRSPGTNEMHLQDGITHTDHPSFEPSTRGANMKPLVDAGLIEPQKKGAISNANYKWTLEGQKLLPLIREMPRVRREKVGDAKGKNGLIPDEFIPILVAIHKNNMFSPEYPDAKLFNAALPTRPTNGDDVETQPVESEEEVDENGDVVEGDGEEPVVPVDENEEPIEQELNNGGDIDSEGESNLDSADVVQQAHDNPDDSGSAEVINALYSHAPSLDGSPQFPTGADGEKFDPSKGDITENYDLLMDMFHDLWDRHNPDSIQRKFGKHTLDGHPYIAPSGRELPGEDNPFMYRIDPTEEDFDTEGYNRARMQAGLLEGWLLTLRSHLAVDNPLDDDGKELYPIEHIYADPKSGSPYTSKYAPRNVRDDFKIQNTHWQWLEALQGLGFVDNNPETGEALPSFASIPHIGHRLSNEAGHGHSFGAGEGFAGLVNAMYGGSGDPDYEGKTIWEEFEGKQKAEFMEAFGRPPVDPETGRRPIGDYGRGAELSSFDKAWKSYQGFLGHSADKWGPVNEKERTYKAKDYPFTQWVTDVLDGKNPENYFDKLPSQLMAAWNFKKQTITAQEALEKESGAVPTRTPDGPTEGTLPPPKIVDEVVEDEVVEDEVVEDEVVEEAPYWDWKDNPEELSGEYEAVGGAPLEEMPTEPPQEIQRRNKRINDILVEEYGEGWKGHPHVADEIESLLDMSEAGKLDTAWDARVVQARKKKRDAQAAADVKEEEKKSNESPPLSDADKQRMLKEIQDAYKEQHGTELDSRHQSLLLNWARTNPDQFNKEHANFIKQAGAAKQKEAKSLREHNANNLDGVEGIRSLAGRSDLRTPDLIQQARLIEKWRHENFADMDTKSKAKLEERWMELHQLAANVEDFNIDEELEKGKQFAKDNDLEYGSSEWLNEIGKQHIDEMHSEGRYKENVAKGGDLRANRNYKPWLVVKYDANGNGVLCDLREKDINGDWGKPVEGGKQGLQFDDDQHYFDYKKDPEDLAQHPNAADHFWTNKLDYANLRPHDGRGGVEDVPEFASHKGAFGERGAIGGWYHPESGAWINPHRYNDARGELEGAGEGAGMAVLSGEAYHGSHRADGQGEVNPRYGFARRGGQQQTKLGNDDLSYYIDGQGNIAHAHADWDKVQKRDNNQVQSVNDVIHDWHSQNMYNMAVNYPDSFKDESGNIRAGTVLRPPQAQAPQPLQNADLFKEVKETDALRRRRAAATGPIRENVYGSGLGEDELGGMGQFWSQPQEWKQKFNDVLDIAEDIPFVPLLSFFARRIANIGNFGFTSDSEKVIRRARNAYQIHAATQKRTKKNMDDLSGNAPEMVYTSPGEILARKEDTKQINTHLSKKLRMHQREAQNKALDSTTREQHRRDALTTQAQRDGIMGLNPELPSDWKKIDGLHTTIFGGEQMREGLVPHPSEDVGVYANRLAQPLPQTQQPTVSPSPISGLLEDTPTQQPQPQQAGALVSDEPLPKPKEPVRGLLE